MGSSAYLPKHQKKILLPKKFNILSALCNMLLQKLIYLVAIGFPFFRITSLDDDSKRSCSFSWF